MSYVKPTEGRYIVHCERCGWADTFDKIREAVRASTLHDYGLASTGPFSQDRRPDLRCEARR